MNLEEILSKRNVPKWIQSSEIWQNWRDYDFSGMTKFYLYEDKVKTMKDFKNVWKAIQFWKINFPYFYSFWEFTFNNTSKVRDFLRDKHDFQTDGKLKKMVSETVPSKDVDKELIIFAAATGSLINLIKLHENGVPWDQTTCAAAALGGHLDCLQYAHEHGCPWYETTCNTASYSGSLDCLKYAHEHGCPWDEETCRNAAESGHLECLEYAHEHGCPWDEWTCKVAAENGHLNCLEYAYDNGCPINTQECLEVANTEELRNYLRSL
jgi:hypothetical protein